MENKIKYDELELDCSEQEAVVKFKGEEIDRVFIMDLVKQFLEEHGYEEV